MAKTTKKMVAANALLGGLVGLGVSACAPTASRKEMRDLALPPGGFNRVDDEKP